MGLGELGLQLDGPSQVLRRPARLSHLAVGQPPVVVSLGVIRGQQYGQVEVAHRPGQVAHLGLARSPAAVGRPVTRHKPDGGVVVRQRQAVFLQFGIGMGPGQAGLGVVRLQGNDPAVVLRRPPVLPQLAVHQPPQVQGFGVPGVLVNLLRQTLDHPLKSLPAQGVHHPVELARFLRRVSLFQVSVFPSHDLPPVCPAARCRAGSQAGVKPASTLL